MGDFVEINCRLCLQSVEQAYLLSTVCDDDITIYDKVCILFNIKPDDLSPTVEIICHECVQSVCNFYTYYQKVRLNNEQLKSLKEESDKQVTIEFCPYTDDDEEASEPTVQTESEHNVTVTIQPYGQSEDDSDELPPVSGITTSEEAEEIKHESSAVSLDDSTEIHDNQEPPTTRKTHLDLPEHLKKRVSKTKGDARIREFIDMTCTICGPEQPIFDTFKSMQMHYEKEHNTRGFVTCCGKKIYRKDRAMDHIALHMDPNAYKCPHCHHSSKSRVLLRIHMKQHLPSEEWPFQCDKCNQRFVLKSQLTNHEATHLNNDEKKFVCDECGKVFALGFVLLKHKRIHSKDTIFFCDVCGKTFSSQASLDSHMKQHDSKEEPIERVQCRDCGQWYKNIQTLRAHEQRHRDTRLHVCGTCNRKCSSRSSLAAHIRYVHMKTSDYECNICTKKFRRKTELTEHMARHTGQALYTCSHCPKTFYSSSNLSAHRKTKHPAEYLESANDPST